MHIQLCACKWWRLRGRTCSAHVWREGMRPWRAACCCGQPPWARGSASMQRRSCQMVRVPPLPLTPLITECPSAWHLTVCARVSSSDALRLREGLGLHAARQLEVQWLGYILVPLNLPYPESHSGSRPQSHNCRAVQRLQMRSMRL